MERLRLDLVKESEVPTSEVGDAVYEEIEAPKFVDFTVPDSSPPDDRSWFCSRVGCDQTHEEVDPDALLRSFRLRVMAARTPSARRRKAWDREAPSLIPKCPKSAHAKSLKCRISHHAARKGAVTTSKIQKHLTNQEGYRSMRHPGEPVGVVMDKSVVKSLFTVKVAKCTKNVPSRSKMKLKSEASSKMSEPSGAQKVELMTEVDDDKENAPSTNKERVVSSNTRNHASKNIISTIRENVPQKAGKHKRTITNPRPFRLRVDERRILKEANHERRLLVEAQAQKKSESSLKHVEMIKFGSYPDFSVPEASTSDSGFTTFTTLAPSRLAALARPYPVAGLLVNIFENWDLEAQVFKFSNMAVSFTTKDGFKCCLESKIQANMSRWIPMLFLGVYLLGTSSLSNLSLHRNEKQHWNPSGILSNNVTSFSGKRRLRLPPAPPPTRPRLDHESKSRIYSWMEAFVPELPGTVKDMNRTSKLSENKDTDGVITKEKSTKKVQSRPLMKAPSRQTSKDKSVTTLRKPRDAKLGRDSSKTENHGVTSKGRRPATVPREPNFHTIHLPRGCSKRAEWKS
ncbi:hypothetical protein ZIOFF_004673 [Zingiber officinale]|uniref:Uncharacterized protein n=1 Tax=Zingiber officinale TaxID=94328 RepID=A0A8J5M3V4_ZINOF|nr:hypothetical protein ZIOFF_004673 [Zingiber officinale]